MRTKPSVILDDMEVFDINRILGFADAELYARPAEVQEKLKNGKIKLLSTTLRNLTEQTRGAQHDQYVDAMRGLNLLHEYLKIRTSPQFWLDIMHTDNITFANNMVEVVRAQIRDLDVVIEIVSKGLDLSMDTVPLRAGR